MAGTAVGSGRPRRVVVIGSTGAGKSTFGRALAQRLGGVHVELDALYWDPDWTPAPRDLFRTRADAALPADGCWVVDGNYRTIRDIVWSRADTLVWLDYPFPLVLWRLAWRSVYRGLRRVELFNGNRESLWKHLFTRESLFLWLVQTHWSRAREQQAALRQPEYAHLRIVRCRWPSRAARWLDSVPRQSSR